MLLGGMVRVIGGGIGSSANTEVLFNNGGVVDGVSTFTFNTGAGRLTATGGYAGAEYTVTAANAGLTSSSSGSEVVFPLGGAENAGGIIISSAASGTARQIRFQYNGTDVMTIDPLSDPSCVRFQETIVLEELAGTPNTVATAGQIYGKDASGTIEVHVQDGAGNETPISPHDGQTGEWVFFSKNVKTGRTVRVNMEKFFKFFDEKFETDFFEEFIDES